MARTPYDSNPFNPFIPPPPSTDLTVSWNMGKLEDVTLFPHPASFCSGVYVIWKPDLPYSRVFYVGQGENCAERLIAHKNDQRIITRAPLSSLHAAWAVVIPFYRDGVERFLADTLNPIVGDRHPLANPVSVNRPPC